MLTGPFAISATTAPTPAQRFLYVIRDAEELRRRGGSTHAMIFGMCGAIFLQMCDSHETTVMNQALLTVSYRIQNTFQDCGY